MTTISLVDNIVQSIDFGLKIVLKTAETYKSADAVLKENTNLEIIANDLISIKISLTTSNAATGTDLAAETLCNGCVEVRTEWLKAPAKVKTEKDPTKWRTVRKALRSVWSMDKIDSLKAQLAGFRDEVNLRIVVSIRDRIDTLTLQQYNCFDNINGDSKVLVDATRSGQHVFTAPLQIETPSLKNIVEHSEVHLNDNHAAAQDEIIAAVTTTLQSNQVEHEATCEEIAQIKLALQQLGEQMERKNDELGEVLA